VSCNQQLGEEIREKVEQLKWSLWHGNVYKTLSKIGDIESLIYNFAETYPKFKQLLKAVGEYRSPTPSCPIPRSPAQQWIGLGVLARALAGVLDIFPVLVILRLKFRDTFLIPCNP
jgi:hypothetical protein